MFKKNKSWDWKEKKVQSEVTTFNEEAENQEDDNEDREGTPQHVSPITSLQSSPPNSSSSSPRSTPKKMRSLSNIYERCNFCVEEPENFKEAIKHEVWKTAVQKAIHVIEKSKT